MIDDSQWAEFKTEPTRKSSITLPVSLADELNRFVYTAKSKGSRITKSAVVTEALKRFLHKD